MQKAIIPASFLTVATSPETTMLQNEDYMYIVREKGSVKASNLYSIFFGAQQVQTEPAISAANVQHAGPDYYSSYE